MFEQSFLQSIGAIQHADGRVTFANTTAADCPDAFITLPAGLALLQVAGADAADFLHGQLSADIKALAANAGTPAAWCTPKGRVITTLVVYRHDAAFYLLLPAQLRERVQKRLQMFVLRANVQITDSMPGRTLLGVRGRGGAIPEVETDFSLHELNGRLHLFLPDRHGESRCLIVDETETLQGVWQDLSQAMPAVDSRCWERLDMDTGLAWLCEATSEEFLPQELNLDRNGGVSFDKGCYPGQEIIARIRYRGQVKRRLFLIHAMSHDTPQPGTAIRDNRGGNQGMIVRAAPGKDKSHIILGVLDCAFADTEADSIESFRILQIRPVNEHG